MSVVPNDQNHMAELSADLETVLHNRGSLLWMCVEHSYKVAVQTFSSGNYKHI